jgi:hypothetical protein
MRRRAVIASDFIVTKVSEQDSNLKWLVDVLGGPVRRAQGERAVVASRFYNPSWAFEREKFFALSGLAYDPISTHIDFDVAQVSQASLDYLKAAFETDDLVVGYELSANTRRLLEKVGVNYLDVWLGPIRFMDDITFALRSNLPDVNEVLAQRVIRDEVAEAAASIVKVQTYRGFARSNSFFERGSALFAGQVLTDKALLKDRKMLDLLDFKDRFEELVGHHSKVYYARHPFMRKGDEHILEYALSFPNVELTDAPSYHALCDPNLKTVAAISSSLVAEARFFDKDTQFFYRPVIDIRESASERYYSLMHDMLFPDFWDAVLRGAPLSVVSPSFPSPKDKLRDALSFYWGYRKIDKIEQIRERAGRK